MLADSPEMLCCNTVCMSVIHYSPTGGCTLLLPLRQKPTQLEFQARLPWHKRNRSCGSFMLLPLHPCPLRHPLLMSMVKRSLSLHVSDFHSPYSLACASLPAQNPACGLVLDAEYEALLVRARATAAAQAAARGLDASAVEPVVPPRPEFPPPYLLLQVSVPATCAPANEVHATYQPT